MIDFELFSKIKHYHEQRALTPAQIARELELDPRTVAKWLAEHRFVPRKSTKRSSKLDPFKSSILQMLETHPYSAIQILQRIREEGFDGRYTIVKDYVRKVRPRRGPAFLKLAFAPGECAQVDWGSYGTIAVGDTRRRLSFFVMVLCYSRMMYLEFTVSQTMEHFLACHQNAFDAFGAVPKKIMVDNLKCRAQTDHRAAPDPQSHLSRLCQHYGFTIAPCGVRKANEKGRVENGVGYVKKNFLAGLDLPISMPSIPPPELVRNSPMSASTAKPEENPSICLRRKNPCCYPCRPTLRYRSACSAQGLSQFRINFDTNTYSVPPRYAGASLTLKIYPDRLCIYHEHKLIARHARRFDRHQDYEDPDHPKALIDHRNKARDQNLFMRFLNLSSKAQDYYWELEKRRFNPRHHVQKIVALSEIYGEDAVHRAIEDAFFFQAFSCEYIANLLEQRSRTLPEPGALHLTRRQDLLEIDVAKPDLSIYQKAI